MLEEDVIHKSLRCSLQLSCACIAIFVMTRRVCVVFLKKFNFSFILVWFPLRLNMVGSVDTLLGCRFRGFF